MSKNKIKQLDRFTFYSLRALRTLNLAFNKIHTIHELAMENLLSLTELNLTGNNLLPSFVFIYCSEKPQDTRYLLKWNASS